MQAIYTCVENPTRGDPNAGILFLTRGDPMAAMRGDTRRVATGEWQSDAKKTAAARRPREQRRQQEGPLLSFHLA